LEDEVKSRWRIIDVEDGNGKWVLCVVIVVRLENEDVH